MDIVINEKPGGFGLSRKAIEALAALGHELARWEISEIDCGAKTPEFERRYPEGIQGLSYGEDIERNDPLLLKVVRDLGPEANGPYARLKIVMIPDDVRWQVSSDDAGCEWVAEEHRIWD